MKCAVDTMLLIWYFDRRKAGQNPETDELRYRTRVLFTLLEEQMKEVVIPSVAVSELLVPMTDLERETFLAEIHGSFECPTFDLKAAALAAKLFAAHKTFTPEDRYEKRNVLKSDILIIATAKSAGVTEFYTHDARARKLAATVMTAKDLPKKHPNFVVDQELRDMA